MFQDLMVVQMIMNELIILKNTLKINIVFQKPADIIGNNFENYYSRHKSTALLIHFILENPPQSRVAVIFVAPLPQFYFLLRILIGISGKLTKIRFNLSVGKLRKNHSLEIRKTTDRALVGANKKGSIFDFFSEFFPLKKNINSISKTHLKRQDMSTPYSN
jgi:hypothetical protein